MDTENLIGIAHQWRRGRGEGLQLTLYAGMPGVEAGYQSKGDDAVEEVKEMERNGSQGEPDPPLADEEDIEFQVKHYNSGDESKDGRKQPHRKVHHQDSEGAGYAH
jgi:hypothetical protein